jgi:hypothetical protein
MTPQVGEIWQARVMGHNYLIVERVEGYRMVEEDKILFKTLRLETGVIELWVVTDEHFRRVA